MRFPSIGRLAGMSALAATASCSLADASTSSGMTCKQEPLGSDVVGSVEFILDTSAARRPTSMTLAAAAAHGGVTIFELSSGDGQTRLSGPAAGQRCEVVGDAIAGRPLLSLTIDRPTGVVVRDRSGEVLAGPIVVSPGARNVALRWGN